MIDLPLTTPLRQGHPPVAGLARVQAALEWNASTGRPRSLATSATASARSAAAAVLCLLLASAAAAAPDAELAALLQPLIDQHQGKVAVALKHLESGATFTYQADIPMPTASLIKLPIMATAYRAVDGKQLDLSKMLTLEAEDKVPGSGLLTPHFSPGTQLSLRDAIRLMIAFSDNTATNLVIAELGLPATTECMNELGLKETRLNSEVYRRDTSIAPKRSEKYGLGSTTAGEMVELLEMLATDKLASPAACEQMLEHLRACEDRTKIVRLLPPEAHVAHKGGAVSASRCDAGIVTGPAGRFAICVLTTDNEDQGWDDDNAAHLLISKIAMAAYDHFNPPQDRPRPEGVAPLTVGSGGKVVADLQRTLNARLEPSPRLGVDGDFGPATQAAVIRFQQSVGLDATGDVGPATWEALGPIVGEEDIPVPSPEEVNSESLPREPADPLEGPPIVTCAAWAIGDGETGEILWGCDEAQPRNIASTTKLMTAYIVALVAADAPEVLDEMVKFSQQADDTIGSTSGIRAGERLPVRELLYGLLLPSGNDASVALAEHFGRRLGGLPPQADPQESYDAFVLAMNAAAQELGMSHSSFCNTSGLPAEGHQATAGDLVVLTRRALEFPLIRKIVATPQHGCQVTGPQGYHRNVVWRSTNQLLKIEGYNGVKTGTTRAAGACLVAQGEFEGRSLIVVTLGSASSPARYADSRNLFRWARWQLQEEK